MIKTNSKGFTLIEVLAVIFVITVGVTGVYGLLQITMSSSNLSSRKLTATYLAQEGVEIVRQVRDSNWLEMRNEPGSSDPWDESFPPAGDAESYKIDYEDLDQEDPTFSSYTGDYLKINTNDYYGYFPGGDRTPFKREVNIHNKGDKLEVEVTVRFTHKGTNHSIKVKENLWKWRGQ